MSQSVEQEHPSAFDFLRSDIRNVEDFFHKRSNGEVKTLGLRRAWSFIVDESVGLSKEEETGEEGEQRLLDILRDWLAKDPEPEPEVAEQGKDGQSVEDGEQQQASKNKSQVDDAVFFSSYIPRSLGEVYDPERDVDLLRSGQGDKLIYASLTGLNIHDVKPEAAVEAAAEAGDKSDITTEATTSAAPTIAAEPSERTPEPSSEAKGEAERQGETKPVAPKPKKGVRWEDEVTPPETEDEEEQQPDPAAFDKKARGFRNDDKAANKVGT